MKCADDGSAPLLQLCVRRLLRHLLLSMMSTSLLAAPRSWHSDYGLVSRMTRTVSSLRSQLNEYDSPLLSRLRVRLYGDGRRFSEGKLDDGLRCDQSVCRQLIRPIVITKHAFHLQKFKLDPVRRAVVCAAANEE